MVEPNLKKITGNCRHILLSDAKTNRISLAAVVRAELDITCRN